MARAKRSSAERNLFIDVKSGNAAGVATALDGGLPIEIPDGSGFTPLMQAVMCEKVSIVRLLLDRGADVHAKWNDGATALHFAARGGSVEITGLLLDHGADPNLPGRGRVGGPPLAYALGADRGDQAAYLLGRGAKIDENSGVHEWLEEALRHGRGTAARFLLKAGHRPAPGSSLWKDPKVVRFLKSEGIGEPGRGGLLGKLSGFLTKRRRPYRAKKMRAGHPLWRYGPLLDRIAAESGDGFGPSAADDLALLRNLGFPDELLEFYAHFAPEGSSIGSVHLDPIASILVDNMDMVPGCVVSRRGYLAFAGTIAGDSFCFDTHRMSVEGTACVVFFDHERLREDSSDEEVAERVVPVADDLYGFLKRFLADDLAMR